MAHKNEEVWKKSRGIYDSPIIIEIEIFIVEIFSVVGLYERCRQLHYLHFKLLYVDGTKPSNITQIERIFLCPAPPQQAACYKWSE